jgi:hypothetical protein
LKAGCEAKIIPQPARTSGVPVPVGIRCSLRAPLVCG